MKELLVLLAALVATPFHARQVPDALWCDLTHDQLARFSDLDADGLCSQAFEASAFYALEGSSPRDVQVRVEGGFAVAYWVDTVLDGVFRGVDANGDGSLEPDEVSLFRASHALDGPSSPDGIELTDDGAVWWSSDAGSHRGLFRLRDENGDGDANDEGEQRVLVDATTPHPFAGPGPGPGEAAAWLDSASIGRLAAAGNGVLAAVHGADEAVYRFEDLDGDGDVDGPGETVLFLNASGAHPALPQNPDFASGALPTLLTASTGAGGEPLYGRLAYLCAYGSGADAGWVLACDSAGTSPLAYNVEGKGINGLFFRAVDLNGDRDANDAGEVRVLYDGSVTEPTAERVQAVVGLDALGDTLLVADVGGGKSIHRLRDLDGDGSIDPESEFEAGVFRLASWGDAVPFPAGHAYVVELAAVPPGLFGPPYAEVSGSACSAWGGAPTVAVASSAALGSTLVCRVESLPAGAPAWLMLGSGLSYWFGAPLPHALDEWGFPGCALYLDPFESYATTADAAGAASMPLSVPAAPPLVGFEVELQWVAAHPETGAVALSALAVTPVVWDG